MSSLEVSPGDSFSLKVQTVAGKSYQLQRSTTLTAGSWIDVGSAVSGDGTLKSIKDDGISGLDRAFYRVVTLNESTLVNKFGIF